MHRHPCVTFPITFQRVKATRASEQSRVRRVQTTKQAFQKLDENFSKPVNIAASRLSGATRMCLRGPRARWCEPRGTYAEKELGRINRLRPGRFGTAWYRTTVPLYHRTKYFLWANSDERKVFGTYQKIPGTWAISALSTEFGPFTTTFAR